MKLLILLVIGIIAFLTKISASEVTFECQYDFIPYTNLRRGHYRCDVFNQSLTITLKTQKFTFTGTNHDKRHVRSLLFTDFAAVDFIPTETVMEFPNLEALEIIQSNLEQITNNLFDWDLWILKVLNLSSNQIERIHEKGFSELTNLEMVDLSSNKIENITSKIFAKNHRLKFISLLNNRINILIPRLFVHLTQLEMIDFRLNKCVHGQFRGSFTYLPQVLDMCQSNCLRDLNCVFGIWKSDPHLLPPESRKMLKFQSQ